MKEHSHHLFSAILHGDRPGVLEALAKGAQVNALYANGTRVHHTPLIYAISSLNMQWEPKAGLTVIRDLLLARADPNGMDGFGARPLHHCTRRSDVTLLLLRAGADPSLRSMLRDNNFGAPRGSWLDGQTPEQCSMRYDDHEVALLCASTSKRIRPRPCLTYASA